MKRRWKSIQSRLLLLLLLVLVPVVVIQAYIYYTFFQERKAAALQTNLELARGVVKTFERFVQEVLHQELSIGLALTLRPQVSAENQSQILLRSRADNPGVWEFFWASPSGVVLSATGPQFLGMRFDDRDYFRKIVSGQDYVISDLLRSRTTGRPSFTISRGIRDEKGALLGIVVAGILPERLDEELGVKRILGGGFGLVDTKGMMVYRYPAIDQTWEERNWIKQYPQFGDALKGKEVGATVHAPFERKNRLVGFAPVPSIGWAASAGQREDEITGPIWAAISRSVLLFGSVLLAAFLLAIVFSRRIANPVEALRRHALALGGGEKREQVPVQAISEFKDLADTFNVMAENVRMREAELKESGERWATTLASIGDGVITTDLAGRITFMNAIAETLTGWRLPEASLKPVAEVFHIINEQSRQKAENPVHQVLEKGNIVGLANHTVLIGRDGTEIPIDDSGAPIKDKTGKVTGVVLVFRDIIERKRAEESLAAAHRRIQSVIDNTPALVYAFDLEERFVMVNTALAELLNSTLEQMIGKRRYEFMPKEDADWHEANDRQVIEAGRAQEFEEYSQLRGRSITWLTTKFPLRDAQGKIFAVAGISADISERKRMQEELVQRTVQLEQLTQDLEKRVEERTEELTKSQERLQNLASQLLLAQENERKRVAGELHDGLLSELAAIKYLLEGKLMLLKKGTSVEADGLKRIADILAVIMKEARRIMNNLHPSVLDELGFLSALSWLCAEYQKSYPHISVQTEITVSERDISDGIRIVIFRVLQEALNNFAKHGKGDRVEVSLSNSAGTFSFVIRDNGQGFDMDKVEKGLGLESMRERVELSGGEFQIESGRGVGTTIRASWLLPDNR